MLPDNVLFEGGAGETIRRELLRDFDLQTMLWLPTGIFCAQGVKANVLFFDMKPAGDRPWTESCRPGGRGDRVESERWKSFTYDELVARDKGQPRPHTWLKYESLENMDNLPAPDVIACGIVEDLTAALAEFEAVAAALEVQLQTRRAER